MAKKKKGDLEVSAKINGKEVNIDLGALKEKELFIVQGTLADEHCNYGIQINTEPTKGMVHNVKGKPLIVHDDLRDAFQKFRAHFAALCDKVGDVDTFSELENSAEVELCHVTGFKIKGAGESETISLIGSYHSMNAQGRIECSTNYIPLDAAEYKWYNELREAADLVRSEIEEYNGGKCTPAPEDEATPKNQKNILEEIAESEEAL